MLEKTETNNRNILIKAFKILVLSNSTNLIFRNQHDEYLSSSVWSVLSLIRDSVTKMFYLFGQRLSRLFLNFTCMSSNTSVSNPR